MKTSQEQKNKFAEEVSKKTCSDSIGKGEVQVLNSAPIDIKNRFLVEAIDKRIGIDLVVKYHYLHRKPPCSKIFGLIDKEHLNEIVGVCCFGVPPSSTLLKGIAGKDESHNIYELNRLWCKEELPRNTESYFISQSLKQIDKEIIVSFADTSQNHIGYVYQATNWLYTGLSTKFLDPKVKGLENQHHATYAHGLSNKELKKKFGNLLYYVERSRKHRYILINTNSHKRKKELFTKLRYKILPYPKNQNEK